MLYVDMNFFGKVSAVLLGVDGVFCNSEDNPPVDCFCGGGS